MSDPIYAAIEAHRQAHLAHGDAVYAADVPPEHPNYYVPDDELDAKVGAGVFFNLILLGYGIPAVLAAILALVARASRPLAYRTIAAAIAVALALSYFSLEIRALYHGPVLWRSATSDVEQYTYSAVWLLFGVILLIAGLLLRSQPARLASAAVMTITIAKVFFIDMAGLTGIFRALSFIGLGAVLVGIGWLYQRLLFPRYARVPQDDGQSRR
jgi:uncharacterized membrane protein